MTHENSAYKREWARKNPGKVKAYQVHWHAKNPGKAAEWRRNRLAKKPEAREAARAAVAKWKKANPEKVRMQLKLYREKKRADQDPIWLRKRSIQTRNRWAKKKAAEGQYSYEDVLKTLEKQRGKCAICLEKLDEKYHVDHIIPLALGGSNDPDNIQITHGQCNLQKGAKHPVAYAQQLGRLL